MLTENILQTAFVEWHRTLNLRWFGAEEIALRLRASTDCVERLLASRPDLFRASRFAVGGVRAYCLEDRVLSELIEGEGVPATTKPIPDRDGAGAPRSVLDRARLYERRSLFYAVRVTEQDARENPEWQRGNALIVRGRPAGMQTALPGDWIAWQASDGETPARVHVFRGEAFPRSYDPVHDILEATGETAWRDT